MTKKYKIPFDKDGNMLKYPILQLYVINKKTNEEILINNPYLFNKMCLENYIEFKESNPNTELTLKEWTSDNYRMEYRNIVKDNVPFYDIMKYKNSNHNKSNLTFYFESINTGKSYPMFFSEFQKILEDKSFSKRNETGDFILSGKFGFIKRGTNYSITFLGSDNDNI